MLRITLRRLLTHAVVLLAFQGFWMMSAHAQNWTVEVIAGVTGDSGYGGDGAKASESAIGLGKGIWLTEDNHILFTAGELLGSMGNRIVGIDLDADELYTVMGNGESAPAIYDCAPIAGNRVFFPGGIFQEPGGDIYFTEAAGHRIRKIDPAANEACDLAGNGSPLQTGNGAKAYEDASSIQVWSPIGIVSDGERIIWIEHTSIRYINKSDSIVTLLAGNINGIQTPYPGDGSFAGNMNMETVGSIALAPDGTIYYGDDSDYIRMINTDLEVYTVAGTGVDGFNGDGVGTSVQINDPYGMKVDENGVLYFCDRKNGRVRTYDPSNGRVTTIIGTDADTHLEVSDAAKYTFNGECINADTINFRPADLVLADDGSIYVYCDYNKQIFRFFQQEEPELTGFEGVPDSFCPNDTLSITVNGDLGDSEQWYWYTGSCGATLLDSGNVVDVPVTDLSTNVYVIADTAGMCLLNEECEVLELNVNCSLGVTAFSPNGDGINDFFEVDIVSVYPTNNMIIFNRYGDEVANIQNYNNIDLRWEGTGPDGLALPGGTYFYLFLDESGSEAARGWVTVLK